MAETESGRGHIPSLERGFTMLLASEAERPNPDPPRADAVTGPARPAVRRILLTPQCLGYVAGDSRPVAAHAPRTE